MEKPYHPLKHHYLQFVAISPFVTHMYTVPQLQLMNNLQMQSNLFLYLDATGTVAAKPEDCNHKILYYALCTPAKTLTRTTTIALAEMLSSDQSTPTIEHWLNCVGRDFFYTCKKQLCPQKVETDFSWAIIHATLHAFCNCSIHEYLQKCLWVCEKGETCTFTVVHICAAHMIKLVCCKVSKIKCSKACKKLFLFAVALLQNVTTLPETITLITDICAVFSKKKPQVLQRQSG